MNTYIPLDDLEVGCAYELDARNIHIGIWDGSDFHGMRRKFRRHFMDCETHWELDQHHGTARAIRKLR
jgi:hypothetical protein